MPAPEPRVTAVTAGPTGTDGAIHDIGYRHDDGPRLGRRAVARALTIETFWGSYGIGRAGRTKIVPTLLLAAMCLPALIGVIVVSVAGLGSLPGPLSYTAYATTLATLTIVFVGAQAPVAVSRDLRFRVVSLYFSRPMRRTDYVRARYAGFALAVLVFQGLPLVVLLLGALLARLPLGEQLPALGRALVGAVLLALVLAGISLVLAAATPRRGLGVAAIITVLVVLSGVHATVVGIALSRSPSAETAAGWAGLVQPFTLVEGVQQALLGADPAVTAVPGGALPAAAFAALTLLVIAGSYALLVARYRKVSVS